MSTGNKYYTSTSPGGYVMRTDIWSGTDGKTNPDGSVKDNYYTRARSLETRKWEPGIACYWGSPTPNVQCGSLNVGCPGSTSTVWTSNDTNALYNKLASAVRTHDFNAGVFLGELKQTVGMVTSLVISLKRSFIGALTQGQFGFVNVKTGRLRKVTQADISDAYLQTVFGALPAISDTIEGVKAFGSRERKSRVVVTHRVSKVIDSSCSPSNYNGFGTYKESQRIMYEMSEKLSRPRELGLLSPYQVAWELTPWSFLFDYFLPIGSYLENVAIIPHLKGRFIHTRKREFSSASGPPPPRVGYYNRWDQKTYYYDTYGATSATYEFSEFTRTPMSGLSVPPPSFKSLPDGLRPGRRVANVIALSHQQVLRFLSKELRY